MENYNSTATTPKEPPMPDKESADSVWEDMLKRMDTVMRSSFHVNTFWHHVAWSKDGAIGKDQHGNWWFNIVNPRNEVGTRPIRVDYYNSAARQFLSLSKKAA